MNINNEMNGMPAGNGRFGASGAVARPKVCGNLEVLRPSKRQCKPRLRQAAGTLGVMQTRQPKIFKKSSRIIFGYQLQVNLILLRRDRIYTLFYCQKLAQNLNIRRRDKPPQHNNRIATVPPVRRRANRHNI